MNKGKRDTVGTSTTTFTTHVIHVDLTDLLGAFDITDNVVLTVATPSGRDKRVAIGGNFLATRNYQNEWS